MPASSKVLRALGVVVAVAIATGAVPALAANGEVVAMSAPNRFAPKTIEIDPGDTVTFRNGGGYHNLVWQDADDERRPVGDPSLLPWQIERTYTEPGTYPFYCDPHRSQGMTGQVTVRDPAAADSGDQGGPPDNSTQDTTIPRVAGLSPRGRQTRRRVRLAFRASEPGTATLYFNHRPPRASAARAAEQPRFRRYAKLSLAAESGPNRVALQTLGGRPIRPGSYRVSLRVADAARNLSRLQRASFTIR